MNSNHTGSGPSFETSPCPIDLLPPEILSHIFTLTLPSARQASSPVVPVIGTRGWDEPWILAGPWIFGQVCSSWRALSIALPTLWTSIAVFSNLTPRDLRLLKSQLARTATAPLELHIRFLWSGHPSSEFNRFLAELVSHSPRWRAIHLEFNDERVVLGNYGTATDTLRGVSRPWAQVTLYNASYHSASTHFRHLPAAVNLVNCDLDFVYSPAEASRSFDLLTLPHLMRLAVSHGLVLARLVAPALRSLYIRGPAAGVLPFLTRSGCAETLTDLTLAACTSPTPIVVVLLQQTTRLVSLKLRPPNPRSSLRH
ncbi:hypothetical protein DFH06DRAFT_1426003, partial [Mycena polygramma]